MARRIPSVRRRYWRRGSLLRNRKVKRGKEKKTDKEVRRKNSEGWKFTNKTEGVGCETKKKAQR